MLDKLKAGVEAIGSRTIGFIEELGQTGIMLVEAFVWAFRPPYRFRIWAQALESIGVGSLPIVLLTGVFSGLVLAYQSHYAFALFNAESLVGGTVAVSVVRELGPVLAGLMVAGRTGSSMTTELGTMRVTEQIDAMAVMAVNPIQYLVTPRVIASILMLPLLTMLFNLVAIVASYVLGVHVLGVDPGVFVANIRDFVLPIDLVKSGIKAAAFGLVIALVGCYKGFYASGGAKGVGEATTSSVVTSSVSILCIDYVLTVLMWD
jgi:phospholipid/cholesterol/gamma-HCH transport system permease protein